MASTVIRINITMLMSMAPTPLNPCRILHVQSVITHPRPHLHHPPIVWKNNTGQLVLIFYLSALASQGLLHGTESNGSPAMTSGGGSTSIAITSTNATNNQPNRSSVYNANNHTSTTTTTAAAAATPTTQTTGTGGVSSNTRALNSNGHKRRIPAPPHGNSYVNNLNMSKFLVSRVGELHLQTTPMPISSRRFG